MSRFIHPRLEDVPLSSVLHALSDPYRLAMIRRLEADRAGEGSGLSCAEGACSDLAPATMSNHYTVLRNAGLVRARKEGVRVIHTLRRDEIDARFPGLLDAVLAAKAEAA